MAQTHYFATLFKFTRVFNIHADLKRHAEEWGCVKTVQTKAITNTMVVFALCVSVLHFIPQLQWSLKKSASLFSKYKTVNKLWPYLSLKFPILELSYIFDQQGGLCAHDASRNESFCEPFGFKASKNFISPSLLFSLLLYIDISYKK